MRWPTRALLWLIPPGILACAVVVGRKDYEEEEAPEPPRITMNHALHLERELVCTDCHDPDETGTPTLPKPETCFECHENLEEENERVRAYFDATRQKDGGYRFGKLPFTADLVVGHKGHADYGIECAACHGEPSAQAYTRAPLMALKASCMGCHEQKGASNDCAVCHEEIRKDKKPADHDAAYRRTHGAQAPEGWRDAQGGLCALCHEVPQSCNECHTTTVPRSHREAGFRFLHGRGDTDALDGPFHESSCALCHEEQSCVLCHQTRKPRSHTTSWERRLHGISAEIERQSCAVCHKQDFCAACHQTTQPVSHRGNWATGSQSHCIACHEPLNATGCWTCHKNTFGHVGAPPKPVDGNHAGASDPADCQECHRVLPHFDDGNTCRRCHR